ncbi:hypothetical protein, partial [Escherichia coli]
MTFDEKELDNAINKIIVTSLFSCLSDTQQKQFYESAFNMIERCCFCDADELPEKIRKLNRPGFPGECFICELRLPDHRFRWKHNKLFLLL